MTEDDTFNRLRRADFTEADDKLVKLYVSDPDNRPTNWTDPFMDDEVELLEQLGWSELDFKKELYTRFPTRLPTLQAHREQELWRLESLQQTKNAN